MEPRVLEDEKDGQSCLLNSRGQWRTGKPGMLQYAGLQSGTWLWDDSQAGHQIWVSLTLRLYLDYFLDQVSSGHTVFLMKRSLKASLPTCSFYKRGNCGLQRETHGFSQSLTCGSSLTAGVWSWGILTLVYCPFPLLFGGWGAWLCALVPWQLSKLQAFCVLGCKWEISAWPAPGLR